MLVFLLTMSHELSAFEEILGVVSDVKNNTILIMINTEIKLNIGNKVELFFSANSEDYSAGVGRVSIINDMSITAEILVEEVPILEDMVAKIYLNSNTMQLENQLPKGMNQKFINNPTNQVFNYESLPSKKEQIDRILGNVNSQWSESNSSVILDTGKDANLPRNVQTDKQIKLEGEKQRINPIKNKSERDYKRHIAFKEDKKIISTIEISAPLSNQLIQKIAINDYDLIWKDSGSGARKDFATFRPKSINGYYSLGDVAVAEPWKGDRYAPPEFETILVKSDQVELKKPFDYIKIWDSRGSKSDAPFSMWKPIPPHGYKCLGEVGSQSIDTKPSLDTIRCLPDQCVTKTKITKRIWRDKGSGADLDYSAWEVSGVNLYIGHASHKKINQDAYTINEECFK